VLSLTDAVPVAHGLGGQKDLPIPLSLAVTGSVAALVISFTVLAVAWRSPRYAGRPALAVPALGRVVLSGPFQAVLKLLGLLFLAYTVMVATLGEDLLTNPVFGIFLVWLWVGIVPASLLLGPAFKAISPHRTLVELLARLTGGDPEDGVADYPARLGYWPAALGLLAFVWFELIYPFNTELGPVRLWLAAYLGVMLVGGAVFGTRFFERADPFEVYSSLLAKLSPWAVEPDDDGRDRLLLRSPLANLDTTVARPGLVAVVAVLLGSTAYDSFREAAFWVRWVQTSDYSPTLVANLAMLGTILLVAGLFSAACVLTPVRDGTARRALPAAFAHAVVPIIAGYMVAHYTTYWYERGQVTLAQVSDPFSNGSDWFGTAGLGVDYWLSEHPGFLATLKVVAVVLGHVVGVVASHERAVGLLPRRHQLTGQLALLVVMVVFTAGGLSLLFAG
jgi:hypothetical protein